MCTVPLGYRARREQGLGVQFFQGRLVEALSERWSTRHK